MLVGEKTGRMKDCRCWSEAHSCAQLELHRPSFCVKKDWVVNRREASSHCFVTKALAVTDLNVTSVKRWIHGRWEVVYGP